MKVIKRVILLAQFALAMFLTPTACSSGVPQERTFELEIREGSLVQEESVLRVKQNDTVTIVVTADEHVGFHLHGYAIEKDAEPGEPATLEFTADATGSFPFTIHIEAEDHEEGADHDEVQKGGHGHEEDETELGRLEVQPR
jgi:hypothetical protein